MDDWAHLPLFRRVHYSDQYIEFLELFAKVDSHEKLFPKECHACGCTFHSLPDFLRRTSPVKHSLEDCKDVMHAPCTMQYQNCACGSTLILTFTHETYPLLDSLWETLRKEAETSGRSLNEVVSDFREQFYHYIVTHEPGADESEVTVKEESPALPHDHGEAAPYQQTASRNGWVWGILKAIRGFFGRSRPPVSAAINMSPRERRGSSRPDKEPGSRD